MATGGEKRLSKLPLPVLEELFRMTDVARKWKELAELLQTDQDEVRYLEYREPHGASPSRKLITDWMNVTDPYVSELFVLLSRMRFYKAMELIKGYMSHRPDLLALLQGEGSKKSILTSIGRSAAAAGKGKPSTTGPAPPPPHGATGQHVLASAAAAVPAASTLNLNLNLNQNCTKEMMSTKLHPSEVAAFLDSRLDCRQQLSAGTLNNISCPGGPPWGAGGGGGGALSPLSGGGAQFSAGGGGGGAAAGGGAQFSAGGGGGGAAAGGGAQFSAGGGGGGAAAGGGAQFSAAQQQGADHRPTVAAPAGAPTGAAAVQSTAAPPDGSSSASATGARPGQPPPAEPTAPPDTEVKRPSHQEHVSSYLDRLANIPQIPYKELESGTDSWSQDRVLGSGGFGTVYRGTWKNTVWAIKRITQRDLGRTEAEQQEQMRQTLEELRILNSCRHDNILPLCGYSIAGPEPLLLYQYMVNGSLLDRIMCRRGSAPLSWLQRHNIARGTARGLQFLHTRGTTPLIHGDIKSANILLDHHLEPKIGDFGLAREFPLTRHTLTVTRVHGTRPYLPDEYLRSRKLSEKVDTFSFGIVLFELTTGLPAYEEKRPIKMLKALVEETADKATLMDRRAGAVDVDIFPALLRVGELCASRRPRDRPDMVRVLSELDSISTARSLAARAQRISIEEAPSVEMSPLELQVLMDRRQQGAASPRPHYQPQPSGGPGLSAGTAPPPYSEVVGWRPAPQPPAGLPTPQFTAAPSLGSPYTPQFGGLSPQFGAGGLSPHYGAGGRSPQFGGLSPQFGASGSSAQFGGFGPQFSGLSPQFGRPSPQLPAAQLADLSGGPVLPQQQRAAPALPTVLPSEAALPTVLPSAAAAAAECRLGPAPLLTALGVKTGSQVASGPQLDSQLSQLSTDGSYTSDNTATQ